MLNNLVDRLENSYPALNPAQRAEMELFNARSRRRSRDRLHIEAEDTLLWLLSKDPANATVIENFKRLRKSFNY